MPGCKILINLAPVWLRWFLLDPDSFLPGLFVKTNNEDKRINYLFTINIEF